MKACPTCNRTFSDETLAFCLVDGSILSAPYDPNETQQFPAPRSTEPAPTEVLNPATRPADSKPSLLSTMQSPQPPPLYSEKQHSSQREKRSGKSWIAIGVVIIMVAVAGIVGFIWLGSEKASDNQPISKVANTNAVVVSSPNPSIERNWCFRGNSGQICTITKTSAGQLQLITEKGVRQSGHFENDTTIALDSPFEGLKGTITPDGNRINWSNGEWWATCAASSYR